MAASNSGPISAEARAVLGEAIRLVFSRWTALQVAVEDQWGGRDSRAKADQFGESILSWFCRSKEFFSQDSGPIPVQLKFILGNHFVNINSIDYGLNFISFGHFEGPLIVADNNEDASDISNDE
ncbi:hypothetical protein PR202_gb14652 [Eleusine coracana subsp. coracana]|uniref:Pre-rRNA-processing protein TSR2 n=1 Tax=Eleusine coracana subsp. coracana TaxID=191504 RepID=A0AAV5EWZ8_ELECO|nr:hypothetical protein PR202_gb14652 [Eleusine coracana subsp. coracana]